MEVLDSFLLPFLISFFLILILFYLCLKPGKGIYPPGPKGYPLFGNLPQIDFAKGLYVKFEEWRCSYGDVFTVYLGPRPVVVLSGYDVIHEAFVKYGDKFMDRPKLYANEKVLEGKGIIFQAFSPLWKEIRRLVLSTMRDLGVGKSTLEEKIVDEVNAIQHEILKFEGKPFEIARLTQNAMANIICSINFGNRFEYDDKKFKKLLDLVNEFFSNSPAANPLNFFPWLRYVPGFGLGLKKKLNRPFEILRTTEVLLKEEIESHRKTFDADNIRDFVDVYLKAEQESSDDNRVVFRDGQLFQTIHDLFNAGSETGATSISWIILYLILNPDVQQKCHEELDRVVGHSRICSIKDKPKLVYLEACILETQRKDTILPTGVPHATRSDVDFHGYHLPKQTMVISNLWSVHHDPKYWDNPDEWKPERWLDENNKIIRHEAFMPFSTGFRTCAGMQLAQMEVFMILACLLQQFKFTTVSGQQKPSLKGVTGITRRPQNYKLCAVRR